MNKKQRITVHHTIISINVIYCKIIQVLVLENPLELEIQVRHKNVAKIS